MIALRNDFLTFSRRADAKISLLKEVLERVQAGEAVDVEGLLGTGNEEKEKEWEEALKEIEEDELLWETKASKMAKKARQAFHESTAAAGSGKEDGCTLASTSLFNEEAKSENNPGTGDSRANSMKSSRQPLSFY
ncbi:hypothetical protein MMC19_003203 [Ptychographa xylographoides]|nr:hypothetical protein [Ptychographa xylographoides]